jgi:hypothetical protein
MKPLFSRREKSEREHVQETLKKTDLDIVDMAARLVRLEAEVGIFKPFFLDDKGPPS